jgi:hypothetical protein
MPEKRKTVYYWKSRQSLEEYFESCLGLSKEEVAKEIEITREIFKLRMHKAIDVRDLWQKTGLNIIKKHPEKIACYCSCNDTCPHIDVHGVCIWNKDCPWRETITVK